MGVYREFQVDDAIAEKMLRQIEQILRSCYRSPRHHNQADPLDELVFIVLSARTLEHRYLTTYREVKRRYPTWAAMLDASPGEIVEILRYGGLESRKTDQILRILEIVRKRFGSVSLADLASADDSMVEDFLISLPGIGLRGCVETY